MEKLQNNTENMEGLGFNKIPSVDIRTAPSGKFVKI